MITHIDEAGPSSPNHNAYHLKYLLLVTDKYDAHMLTFNSSFGHSMAQKAYNNLTQPDFGINSDPAKSFLLEATKQLDGT